MQHHVVLRVDGNHEGGELAALALVDAHGVGGHHFVKLSEVVGHDPPVEIDRHLGLAEVHLADDAKVAVEHVLVVVVLRLENLVPRAVGVRTSPETPSCRLQLERVGIAGECDSCRFAVPARGGC